MNSVGLCVCCRNRILNMAWNCESWRRNQTCGLFGAVAAPQPWKWIVLVLWISRRQQQAVCVKKYGSMSVCWRWRLACGEEGDSHLHARCWKPANRCIYNSQYGEVNTFLVKRPPTLPWKIFKGKEENHIQNRKANEEGFYLPLKQTFWIAKWCLSSKCKHSLIPSHGFKPVDKMESESCEVTIPAETSTDIKIYPLRSW